MSIQIPAILTGFATKVDGGASIRFNTNELNDLDILELKRKQGTFGYLLFKENQFKNEDVPTEEAEDTSKTPSKRLRAVLFVYWNQKVGVGNFDSFYREKMEEIIQSIKEKIDN
jgi:hypothetical protein